MYNIRIIDGPTQKSHAAFGGEHIVIIYFFS